MGAIGIGLGSSEPPLPIRENSSRNLQHKSSLPRTDQGPGLFSYGSFEKYVLTLSPPFEGREGWQADMRENRLGTPNY